MSRFANTLSRFVREEDGASLAEYALLLGVITVALIAVITTFRDSITGLFNKTTTALNTAG